MNNTYSQFCNAKYICLLYQSPPTSYAKELTWYLLKACDSETFHFLWDEKHIVQKRKKTNPPHWFITLLRLTDDSLLNYILQSTTESDNCNRTGWAKKAEQGGQRGCRIHAVILGRTTADAKGWEHCLPLHLKWAIPMHNKICFIGNLEYICLQIFPLETCLLMTMLFRNHFLTRGRQ